MREINPAWATWGASPVLLPGNLCDVIFPTSSHSGDLYFFTAGAVAGVTAGQRDFFRNIGHDLK
jgi:hypothetical protein